ncbi:hypothetical protein PV328_002218 [Microctonus aethiopoides]|uniref:Uncharacterized protein n=1 Tax=Microctonus aethiopoides TaxID=144406 RepID=A0AA39FYU3_9HYME|nr:hypothetical protein PV328_002218 [Microctonus aethiopoides]
MGNSNSSHHQHCHSTAMSHEMGRGWTQSFPRELSRHHAQQPPGHKVLPEPSNQRLRATNNGNIIHNGGTISGRRPSSLTLPHDLNKQSVYRSRSTSASNIGESHGRKYNQENQHCCAGHYRPCDGSCRGEMVQIKRFGSEPDLRYSPNEPKRQSETRQSNGYYPERESRYRGKKKYKAPTPPINCDGSSPDSYKWEVIGQDQRDYCRQDDNDGGGGGGGNGIIQAPPRRSRLFKTRAETKKQTSNWPMSTSTSLSQQDSNNSILEKERRWRSEKQQQHQQQQQQQQQQKQQRASGKENRPVWRDYHEQDRWSRNERANAKQFDGKNTLQRSLSSPEFQAELVQVAKKVRNKLYYNRRVGPVGAAVITNNTEYRMENLMSKSMDRKSNRSSRQDIGINERREKHNNRINQESFDMNNRDEIRNSARFNEEKKFHERGSGKNDNRVIKNQEIRSYDKRTTDSSFETKANDRLNERLENGDNDVGITKRRILEKSTGFEENVINNGDVECIFTRTSINNRVDGVGNMKDQQQNSTRQLKEFNCKNDRSKTSVPFVKTRNNGEAIGHARTRSESPVMRQSGDRMDVRGQGSGRESTPEPPRGREKKVADNRHKRINVKDASYGDCKKRWSERSDSRIEKIQIKSYEKNIVNDSKGIEKNWNLSNSNNEENLSRDVRGVDHQQQTNRIQSRLQDNNYSKSQNNQQDELNDEKNHNEDIALKLRPTLPKKQLEIPRFSPSAAWRLLSALETSGPTPSTASEEIPVMYEERIERMSRPPPLLIALGPRSSHDKSGDSGVSCDAGVPNDDLPDVSTNRMKSQTSRPAWTPQQDLGEESSSDAGVDSPPPMVPDVKFSSRPHVFSLSLPRDDGRHCPYTPEKSKSNNAPFNSLQKMRKSVSGAFGLSNAEFDRKRPGETLDDNWVLSTSAPTSLQHSQVNQVNHKDDVVNSKRSWEINYDVTDFEDETLGENEEKAEFPVVMKPHFSYLASGGHVMYLPASNSTEHRTQSLNYRDSVGEIGTKMNNINGKHTKTIEQTKSANKSSFINGFCNGFSNRLSFDKSRESSGLHRERSFIDLGNNKNQKHSNFSKSCENISEMRQHNGSQNHNRFAESLQDKKIETASSKVTIKPNPKGKRFTFQSTVRQIERRRLAEKLSREAEAKERQRRNELEAMRKVEEEFQRKRAKEKANIRQQLRLYSMDENSSLPPASDSSHLSRADPDGAPSSSASSPTSAPPGKLAANNRKGSVNNSDYHRKKECRIQQQKHEPREYKDYRIKYYDWAPNNDSSSHLEVKQTTVHPKVVCDIPKSSHVFIDANGHTNKSANLNSTPRSDNYRKDFAHGAIAGRSSLASSDSELSQPNTRPHSRQNGNKSSKPIRTRF